MGGLPARQTVYGFAVNPKNAKHMYAAMRKGLFQSVDGGRIWTTVSPDLKNLASVAIHPMRPAELYASTVDGIIFHSEDEGKTWRRRN